MFICVHVAFDLFNCSELSRVTGKQQLHYSVGVITRIVIPTVHYGI
jgi:hypothetical protein